MSNCRRNFAVWSKTGVEHPDYYRFVLRDGSIDSEWRSVNNFSNDQFLQEKPAYAGLVRTNHKHKIYDENVEVRNVGGQLVVDTEERDDVYALRDQRDSENTTLLVDLIRNMPWIAEQEEIQRRLAELDRRVPQNIPKRNEVLDALIKDFLISRFKLETQGSATAEMRRIGTQLTPIQERLRQLVAIASADERQAESTIDIATATTQQQGATQETQEERITQEALRRQGVGRPQVRPQLIQQITQLETQLGITPQQRRVSLSARTNVDRLRSYLEDLQSQSGMMVGLADQPLVQTAGGVRR
jgi:hypothetical protein